MFNLRRLFKNYEETGSFNEQISPQGFIDEHLFLTKAGDLGAVLEVRGVDFECLDGDSVDGFTKRLESALKLFDEKFRVYQYIFRVNNQAIPHKLYGNPVVDTAISNRIAYLASKADKLFSLSIYYVVLFEGFRYQRRMGSILLEFPKHPLRTLGDCGPPSPPESKSFSSMARSARGRRIFTRNCVVSSCRSVTSCQCACSTSRRHSGSCIEH